MLILKKRLIFLTIWIISIVTIFLVIFQNVPTGQQETEQYQLEPNYLGSSLIYASPIIAPLPSFFGRGEWQKVTIPKIFLEEHGHYEIWDGNNKPIAGFVGRSTSEAEIDLSTIPFSHKSALRIVIFPDLAVPDLAVATFGRKNG